MKIIGISGSPVPESNTDRAVVHLLKASGLNYEFIKLSKINVKPCLACKRCVEDNICKINDDFPNLAEKIRNAQALVIGGYTPYRMLDAYTKSFMERLWSMRHVHSQNENKYAVTIISGLAKPIRDAVLKSMAIELSMERMYHVAEFGIEGNVPCLTCGCGDDCKNSGLPFLFGGKKSCEIDFKPVESQSIWQEIEKIGGLIGKAINEKTQHLLPKLKTELS